MNTIIAIIPAFNEQNTVEKVILETKKYVNKVILVDDGSNDNTYINAKKYADVVVRHSINMGKGTALKTGFQLAYEYKPEIIITIDADGQHNPTDIKKLIDALKLQNADIAIGNRYLNESAPIIFKFGNWFIKKTFSLLFGANIVDTQSGLRAHLAEKFNTVFWESEDYAVETEILINSLKKGLKVVEVPIKTIYEESHKGKKGTTVFDGIKIFIKMLIWRLQ